MLPALQMCGAVAPGDLANRTFIEKLADQFQLTDDDRKELLAGGKQSRFENRVYWALVYLRRAGLIASSGRGRNRITERGQEVLGQAPKRIDIRLLSQFPEFRDFREAKAIPAKKAAAENEDSASPAERMEAAFAELGESLVSDLLLKLHAVDPFRFEKVVLDVLVAMKYGGSFKEAAAVTQKIETKESTE